ncbi:MAG: NAD(+)/NADH kinase [Sulfolobales archaeon]|nr:NAD(+)/NADH kinase [Sulfolobales archaeon]MDW8082931.1 NAD(+)/NADH kinase [Sulfolobales archaeon]
MDSRARGSVDWLRYFILGVDEVGVIAVVGGDGTILRTTHLLKDADTPVMTIRYGKRGFLADVPPHDYALAIDRLLSGRYVLHEYMRLLVQAEGVSDAPYALNDAVLITSSEFRGKVCRLRVMKHHQGGVPERVLGAVGDGVIVATPVGSTAYSLAAGGPIVDPLMKAIIITPLAPISLCSKPVVLPDDVKIIIEIRRDSYPVELYVDGILVSRLEPGISASVSRAPKPARIVRFFAEDYYSKVFERCL